MEMLTLARCGTHGVDWVDLGLMYLLISGLAINLWILIQIVFWLIIDVGWTMIFGKKEDSAEESLDTEEKQP